MFLEKQKLKNTNKYAFIFSTMIVDNLMAEMVFKALITHGISYICKIAKFIMKSLIYERRSK
tara:strand:+ start:48578 stop:48763 length:186 start_codon:yes stop_codon:yes gene_type:complete